MEFINNHSDKYLKVFSRLGKHIEPKTGFLLMIRSYLTNNIYYYLFCVLFRALFLIMVSGNYMNPFLHINGQKIQNSSKILTLHYIFKIFSLNYKEYNKILLVLYILFFLRLLLTIYTLMQFSHYKSTLIIPSPFKYQILVEHLLFLFFPYLLEFLALPFYIYFCKEKFFIKLEDKYEKEIITVMVINMILIVIYNYQNYICILCTNQNYSNNDSKAILRTQNEKNFDNSFISYRDTKLSFICLITFQNIPLIQNIENFIGDDYVEIYKAIISIILILLIIILIREKLYLYNYNNLINVIVAIFIIFCFYSIILDIIFYISKYEYNYWLTELIYIIEKLLFSFISYLLIIYRSNKYLQKQIIYTLFQDKNKKKKNNFINAFIYLNQIMIQIKEKNNYKQNILLVNFLNSHIIKCNKSDCNCKLISAMLRKDEIRSVREKNNTSNLLIALNYLYESSFFDYDYYNNYDLTILLAEHYCHLVDNPTMAFSFIISLLIRQNNKLSRLQKIVLYELCEKYIYYILANIEAVAEVGEGILDQSLLMNKQKFDYFQNYFLILKSSHQTKILMNKYINNLIKILKYKSIFEDTLTVNYDESNDITNVQINFFNLSSNIKSNINDSIAKKKKKLYEKKENYNYENTSNIYKVINILKKEQNYNKNIIDSANNLDITKDIPMFLIYKYYLFFDLFKNGEIPLETFSKFNIILSRYKTINSNRISNKIYSLLKRLYQIQNNRPNSKFFAIFEFKKELTTKYFDEKLSSKLGYKQKDIIKEKMDELMPKEFSNSHRNMIKRLFLGDQKKFFKIPENYIFDSNHTVMYLVDSHGVMIYNLSNYLFLIYEMQLIANNDYIFMLNHNFELIANTKNFTNDYFLNQKIFVKFKLSLLEMLKSKQEKIIHKFSEEFKSFEEQKELRQIKTEEYLIPQLYVPLGEKNIGMMQINNYNTKKNKLLVKFSNLNNDMNNKINFVSMIGDNEQEKLIQNERSKEETFEILMNNTQYVIKKNFNFNLNKMVFIENIAKELTKILDNELTTDNNSEQYLVTSSKRLISDLLTRKELLNNTLNVGVKMHYFYDRPFYFININDEKKIIVKLNKFVTSTSKIINRVPSPRRNFFRQNSSQFWNKRQNSSTIFKDTEIDDNNSINSFINYDSKKKITNHINISKIKEVAKLNYESKREVVEKIDKYRAQINRDKFILIIKSLLFIFITGILIIYILIMILQRKSINMIEKILLTFYYNAETKNIILNIYSKLIGYFHDLAHLTTQGLSATYLASVFNYTKELRINYHSFKKNFIEYNLDMKNSFQIIYQKKKFYKLRGKWREIVYDSDYFSELDYLIHSIFSIEYDNKTYIEKDINTFLFYQNRTDREEKINTIFIKLIFYFSVNYENVYKSLYDDINSEIYSSYSYYSRKGTITNYSLEISSLILYLFFFICCFIFLYYSNLIIIKNIIFLFLDFSQEQENKDLSNSNVSNIMGKLLKFQNLLNDFNLENVNIYSEYLDKANNKESITDNIKETKTEIKNTESHEIQRKKNVNKHDMNKSKGNDIKSLKTNASSQNILIGGKSEQLIPEKISSGPIVELKININQDSTNKALNFKKLLRSTSINSPSKIKLQKTLKIKNNNLNHKNSLMSETDSKENFAEAVLDRSNKITIYIIKIHSAIIIFFTILTACYSAYKIRNNTIFIEQYGRFYSDFNIVEERYSSLYYYWNTMQTIMIFHYDEERWNRMSNILEKMNSYYEKITNNYNQLLSKNMNFYSEVEKLFEIFTYNKNDSVEYLKKNVCMNESICNYYIATNDSIFNSGIDFGYKIGFSFINNIFMDYQSIKNKTSIQEIIDSITGEKFYEFRRMKQSFSNVFYFLKEKIFKDFKSEAISFGLRYKRVVLTLNICSLIISVLILWLVIICIFITVSNYSQPIKDSTYRINHSFFYIKNYSLTK